MTSNGVTSRFAAAHGKHRGSLSDVASGKASHICRPPSLLANVSYEPGRGLFNSAIEECLYDAPSEPGFAFSELVILCIPAWTSTLSSRGQGGSFWSTSFFACCLRRSGAGIGASSWICQRRGTESSGCMSPTNTIEFLPIRRQLPILKEPKMSVRTRPVISPGRDNPPFNGGKEIDSEVVTSRHFLEVSQIQCRTSLCRRSAWISRCRWLSTRNYPSAE